MKRFSSWGSSTSSLTTSRGSVIWGWINSNTQRRWNTASSFSNSSDAARYKSQPIRHSYFLGLCGLCAAAGVLAGQVIDIDQSKMPNAFILEDVCQDLKRDFDFRPDLAPTMIRMCFIYCLGEGMGGQSFFRSNCPLGNAGLEDAKRVVHTITLKHHISHSDALTLSAVYAIQYLGGPKVPWRCGRVDPGPAATKKKQEQHQQQQQQVILPHPVTGTLTEWLSVFQGLGFSTEEFVALVGAHTVGGMHHTGTGRFNWTKDRFRFNNNYFQTLSGLKYKPATYDTAGVVVGVGSDAMKHSLGALPWEIEMATKEKKTMPIVKKFAQNEEEWLSHFTSGFVRLCELGDEKAKANLRDYIIPSNVEAVRSDAKA
eukprot:PhF_6_TR40959/c0_g1_i1/m.61997/K00428/E1.11.1.5; cytochrome c peroxidase